jgi:hypothetical protein
LSKDVFDNYESTIEKLYRENEELKVRISLGKDLIDKQEGSKSTRETVNP